MKAVVFEEKGKLVLIERPKPCLEKDTDVLVKVTLTTICSSDIHIKHGAVPRAVPGTILGHEFVGVVEETGKAVKKVKPGDRVAVNVETYCGNCFYCERGFVNNCSDPLGGWTEDRQNMCGFLTEITDLRRFRSMCLMKPLFSPEIFCLLVTGRQKSEKSAKEIQWLLSEQGLQGCAP